MDIKKLFQNMERNSKLNESAKFNQQTGETVVERSIRNLHESQSSSVASDSAKRILESRANTLNESESDYKGFYIEKIFFDKEEAEEYGETEDAVTVIVDDNDEETILTVDGNLSKIAIGDLLPNTIFSNIDHAKKIIDKFISQNGDPLESDQYLEINKSSKNKFNSESHISESSTNVQKQNGKFVAVLNPQDEDWNFVYKFDDDNYREAHYGDDGELHDSKNSSIKLSSESIEYNTEEEAQYAFNSFTGISEAKSDDSKFKKNRKVRPKSKINEDKDVSGMDQIKKAFEGTEITFDSDSGLHGVLAYANNDKENGAVLISGVNTFEISDVWYGEDNDDYEDDENYSDDEDCEVEYVADQASVSQVIDYLENTFGVESNAVVDESKKSTGTKKGRKGKLKRPEILEDEEDIEQEDDTETGIEIDDAQLVGEDLVLTVKDEEGNMVLLTILAPDFDSDASSYALVTNDNTDKEDDEVEEEE